MADAEHTHRQTEARLNAIARRHFPAGSYHVDFADVAKLGGGDLERGETILHRMFRMSGPRSLHPSALRELGNGNAATGRRVIDKFLDRLHKGDKPQARYARGGRVDKISKADAGYEACGDENRICVLCSMWRDKYRCSLVAGHIDRTGTCKHFSKKAGA
jgi:hypothetical protein